MYWASLRDTRMSLISKLGVIEAQGILEKV
jgi:hypothetical protein